MSFAASSYGRVSNLMSTQIALTNLNRTNRELFEVNQRLATGLDLNVASDDPIRAAGISALDAMLERSGKQMSNLNLAISSLDLADTTLGDAISQLREALDIGSSELSFGASAEERASQSVVVQSILDGMSSLSNTRGTLGYVFGGSTALNAPLMPSLGGYRLTAGAGLLFTDTGGGRTTPVTLDIAHALGSGPGIIRGFADLDPEVTPDTPITVITGSGGGPLGLGAFEVSINGSGSIRVDVSEAEVMSDVLNALEAAIVRYEQETGTTVLGPGGVGLSNNQIQINVASGSVVFSDLAGGAVAQQLGLSTLTGGFVPSSPTGDALEASLHWEVPITALAALGGSPLGSIQVSNGGLTRVLDLSGAETLDEVKALLEGSGLGITVELNADGNGLDIHNNLAHSSDKSLRIAEVGGGSNTATALGIRSISNQTPIANFNFGRGVSVLPETPDPVTGLPDPRLSTDFTFTLGDGFEIDIDLRATDMVNVDTMLTAINTQAAAQLSAAGRPASDFTASVPLGQNGLMFTQDASVPGAFSVSARNNSTAAEQLGLLDGGFDTSTGGYVTSDRTGVRVDNAFSALLDLRDALSSNDSNGIGLATERLDGMMDILSQAQAQAGSRSRRLNSEQDRLESSRLLDQQIKSSLQDTDFTAASVEFSLLQTQLQAGLQTTAQISRLTLLNFL